MTVTQQPPEDGRGRRAPWVMTQSEKAAAEREARHDSAARGSHGSASAVQDYLAHVRAEEVGRAPEHPTRPVAGTGHRPTGGREPQPVPQRWWRRLLRVRR